MNKRLTKKAIGVFKYDLADYEHKFEEFNDYDAFFAYHMAVKRLGELEDEHDNYQQEIENLKSDIKHLKQENIDLMNALREFSPFTNQEGQYNYCYWCGIWRWSK